MKTVLLALCVVKFVSGLVLWPIGLLWVFGTVQHASVCPWQWAYGLLAPWPLWDAVRSFHAHLRSIP